MGIDKYKAKHHQWRIAEITLLTIGFVGGGIGGLLGMFIFHHKTRKLYFYLIYLLSLGIWSYALGIKLIAE